MQKPKEILDEYLKVFYEVYKIKTSDKSIPFLTRAMKTYAAQEAKAYANWLTKQVIAGRTYDKLWNDYKNESYNK